MSDIDGDNLDKVENSENSHAPASTAEVNRCPHCGIEVAETVETCPVCHSELLGTFKIDRDLIEEAVENHITLLGQEFDLKSLRLADDTAQLIARSRIREIVRLDASVLTIFERGIVLQHLLNIVFNSRDEREEDCLSQPEVND